MNRQEEGQGARQGCRDRKVEGRKEEDKRKRRKRRRLLLLRQKKSH